MYTELSCAQRGTFERKIQDREQTQRAGMEKKNRNTCTFYDLYNIYSRSVFTPSDPSQNVRARPDLHHHVLLHQVETHGDQRHAEHQVHGAQYEAELDAFYGTGPGAAGVGHVAAGHEVAEPDGAQRYETEIRAVEELPVFPFGKQHGTSGYVPVENTKYPDHTFAT